MTNTIAATFRNCVVGSASRVSSDLLGPAYCISLAHQTERRRFCRRQFLSEGVDVTFVDGIVPADRGRFPTRGAYGCFLTHLQILETAIAEQPVTGARYITIFEDDVLLPRSFSSTVATVMRQLRGLDWHIVYWGTENNPPVSPVPGREPLATIAPQQTIIGKQAYTIRLDTVPELVNYLHFSRQKPNPAYSDGMYHEFRMMHDLPAYTHTLRPARQASFASNITPGPYGWIRRPLRAVKRQVQLWRR